MDTSFILIFTFLLFQTIGLSIITTSSNVTCIQSERRSLLLFKQNLTDRYRLLSTWTGEECCEWYGVGCDGRNGHVITLDLRSQVSFIPTYADLELYYYSTGRENLEGELSPSLQNLKHLRYLDLSLNSFSGNIPEFFGSFEHLEYLILSHSGLGGVVPHLGNLSKLQYLDLRNYYDPHLIMDDLGWVSSLSSLRYLDLTGTTIGNHADWFHRVNMLHALHTLSLGYSEITNIPSIKFVNFTSLTSLDLSYNHINSTFPVWISNLTALLHLDLSFNQFYGKIPDFHGMTNLVHLDLSGNMFSGPIPTSLGLLWRLENLYIGYNQLSGNVPMSIGQLSKLKILSFPSNSLPLNFSSPWIATFQLGVFIASSCNIGPRFPSWLQTQRNIHTLILSNTSIKDTIPPWFENILSCIRYLDLSYNQISGKLPRIHFDNSSYYGDGYLKMNSNKFEGSLAAFPSNVEVLDLSDNLLSGHLPQTDEIRNSTLQIVNLSKNNLTGRVPEHICKNDILIVLNLSRNKFYGTLPGCLGNLTLLGALDLSDNTITGVVPSSLGSLTQLHSLHLRNNIFEGNLSLFLQNLTELVTLDLGNNLFMGTIPFWFGEKLSKLRFLNLQLNKFTGKIPLELCQLIALQYLSLAHNNITGTIPSCFRNLSLSGMVIDQDSFERTIYYWYGYYVENILTFMKGTQLVYTNTIRFLSSLDLSSNNITGEIPDVLMNLAGLKSLNLSRNQLKGHIPLTIGNLSQMESLDLSMNMLSGQIPQSMTSLNFLSYLNLSFNNLSGAIPVGNQLQTLVDPYNYEGNDGLCGPPLSRSCNGNNSSFNHVGQDEDHDDDGLWFYFGMGPGFVVGFIGLLGSLHFIRSWRVAYFGMFENVYNWLTVSTLVNLARLKRNFC